MNRAFFACKKRDPAPVWADVFWCTTRKIQYPLVHPPERTNLYVSACCFVLSFGSENYSKEKAMLHGRLSAARESFAHTWWSWKLTWRWESVCQLQIGKGNFKRCFSILRFIIDVWCIIYFQMKQVGSSWILRDFVSCCRGSWWKLIGFTAIKAPLVSLDDGNFCSEARSGKHLQNEVDIKK